MRRVRSRSRRTGPSRSDDELLLASRTDPQTFGIFFDRHYEEVLLYFATRGPSPEAAADLCAETLAAALEGLDRFDPAKGSAMQWVYGIAAHKLSHHWRTGRVSRRAQARLRMRHVQVDADTAAEIARVEARVDAERVFVALDRLPSQLATAVRLRILDQLDYREIAATLGCSEGAVRVRVHRGLRRLELALGQGPSP